MGLFNSLVNVVKNAIYGSPSKEEVVVVEPEQPSVSWATTIFRYTYNTVEHVFSQFSVLPKTVKDLWLHEPSAPIVNTILQTLYYDVFPLIALNAANDIIQDYADDKRDKNAPWMDLNTTLYVSQCLLQLGVNLYTWHRAGKALINNSTANLFVSSAFSSIERKPPSETVCGPKCTTGLVVLNNYINETATLYTNEVTVFLCNRYAPYGTIIAPTFSLFSNGRYLSQLTTSNRCTEHKHLQSEYTLALGITYKGLEWSLLTLMNMTIDLLNSRIGSETIKIGMPPFLCMVLIRQSMFLFQLAMAAHLTPPLTEPKNKTISYDPVEAYEAFSNWALTKSYEGIKSLVARMLNGPPSTINWADIANQGIVLLHHPNTHAVQCFLLPPLVHSWENFINAPIISPYWDPTHAKIIKIIETFEKYSRSNVVHVANKAPGKAAKLFQLLLGVPTPVAKAVLEVMSNERKMAFINAMRVWLEDHSVKKLSNVTDESPNVPLNDNPVNVFEENKSIMPLEVVEHVKPDVVSQLTERRKPSNHDFFKAAHQSSTKRPSVSRSPLQLMGNT